MKATSLLIERYSHGEKQTIGNIIGILDSVFEVFRHDSLELPWLDNQQNISCIPVGEYTLKKRHSKKHKEHLHIQNVPNRTLCLIHVVNYYTQIEGCIGVGKLSNDINGDGIVDLVSSRKTLKSLMNSIEFDENGEIKLTIVNI